MAGRQSPYGAVKEPAPGRGRSHGYCVRGARHDFRTCQPENRSQPIESFSLAAQDVFPAGICPALIRNAAKHHFSLAALRVLVASRRGASAAYRRAPIKRPLEVYPAAPRAQNCSELKNAAQPRFATLAPPLNDGESKTLFQAKEHWARRRDGARCVGGCVSGGGRCSAARSGK